MKKYIFVILLSLCVFMTSGCVNKSTLSTKKFINITSNYKLKSNDITKQFTSNKDINKVLLAEGEDGWQVEYYIFDNRDAAKKMYDNNMKYYNDYKKMSKYHDNSTSKNRDEYTLIDEETYIHVCRIKNTLLYVSAPIDAKTDVEKVLRALKY